MDGVGVASGHERRAVMDDSWGIEYSDQGKEEKHRNRNRTTDEKHVSPVPASLFWSQIICYREGAMIKAGSIILPDQRSRSQHIRVK